MRSTEEKSQRILKLKWSVENRSGLSNLFLSFISTTPTVSRPRAAAHKFTQLFHKSLIFKTFAIYFLCFTACVRHVTGTGSGLLGEIPRVVVQKSALL